MRVNSHIHGMRAVPGPDGKLRGPMTISWKPGKLTPEELVAEHRKRGMEKVLLLDPPETCFEVKKIFGDFVVPVPMVNTETVTPEDIDALLKKGAAGIKFIAPMRSYSDNCYFPLYEVIRDNHALAVFHTGFLCHGLHGPGCAIERPDWPDITNMRPAAIDRIVRAFPDLKILMAHFGNPWWEEAWKMISSLKNVYADFSGGTAFRRSMSMWEEIFAPNGVLDTASVEKLCFGTDGEALDTDICFDCHKPVIEFYERFYDTLKLPTSLREKIDRDNTLSLISGKQP